MNYKVAICDDEPSELTYLSGLVNTWANQTEKTARISTFPSSEAFLFHYAEEKDYDILLLDIEMKAMNGVELVKKIRMENSQVQIIFITGYPDFIAEGYEVSALHYLMKPVSEAKLSEVLNRACDNLHKCECSVLLKVNGEQVRININHILYVEACAHSVMFYLKDQTYEVKMSFTETQNLLGEAFVRCHRSYLVNLQYIARISKSEVTLDSGIAIPLSRSAYSDVNRKFISYYTGGSR